MFVNLDGRHTVCVLLFGLRSVFPLPSAAFAYAYLGSVAECVFLGAPKNLSQSSHVSISSHADIITEFVFVVILIGQKSGIAGSANRRNYNTADGNRILRIMYFAC